MLGLVLLYGLIHVSHVLGNTETRLVGLQIVFLHGDVLPDWHLFPDGSVPTVPSTANGLGPLSSLGRARSYRLGQWLRFYYSAYLESMFEGNAVQARTSATEANAESMQAFLAGCFPPNSPSTRWDILDSLGVQWQPIVYHDTSATDGQDRAYRECPEVTEIRNRLHSESKQVQQLFARHKPLLKMLGQVWNQTSLDSMDSVTKLYWDMRAQHENGHYWYERSDAANWTRGREDSMVFALSEFQLLSYETDYAHLFVIQTRIGSLLNEINDNFYWNLLRWTEKTNPRLILYSVSREKLVPLLHALGAWRHRIPSHSEALLFELHQSLNKSDEFFIQLWYMNQTDRLVRSDFYEIRPIHLMMTRCVGVGFNDNWMCPLNRFRWLTHQYRDPLWWDWSCGVHSATKGWILLGITLLVATTFALNTILFLLCYLCGKCCHCSTKPKSRFANTTRV